MNSQIACIVATTATILTASTVSAATLGTPSFTTEPARISIVNEFGPFGRFLDVAFAPFDAYTVTVETTIASSEGLPGLVGQTLSFAYTVFGDFGIPTPAGSLVIGGTEVMVDPLFNEGEFLFFPPIANIIDGAPGEFDTFEYADPFADFGPRTAEFPEFIMDFQINEGLPLRIGYEQCNIDGICEFSADAPLTEIGGLPIVDVASYSYVEGSIEGGTITFFTPGGPPPAAIPVPAAGLLLLGALGGLGLARRRR